MGTKLKKARRNLKNSTTLIIGGLRIPLTLLDWPRNKKLIVLLGIAIVFLCHRYKHHIRV